jgi:LPXTG-motif cell wall-anchored protein
VSPKRVAERTVADVKSRAGHLVASVGDALGVTARPVDYTDDPDRAWEEERASLAPVLIGVGAVLVVGAAIVLFRRRRKRRH